MLIAIPNMISQITSPNAFFEVYCFQLYPIINLDYQAVTNTPSLTFFRCPFTFLSFIQSIDNYMLHHPAYLITYGVLQMMYYTICSETNLPYTLFHMRPYVMLYSPYMFYGLPYTINNQNIKKISMYSSELSEVPISEIETSSCLLQCISVTLLQTMYTYLQFFAMQH